MADNTGYTYGVRQGLVNKGVSNSEIGYNPNTGYVTIKGENFMRPSKTANGVTYDTQQGFDNAWNTYSNRATNGSAQQMPTAQNNPYASMNATGYTPPAGSGSFWPSQSTQQPTQQPAATQQPSYTAYNPYQTNNPYDTQTNQLIAILLQQAQNPTPVDVNAIYQSPQWAAYQAQADRGAQQATRAAQESLGASGFGRSTALTERTQGIQNDANTYMNSQVLPQLIAAEEARRQQGFNNLGNVLSHILGQQGIYDNRFNAANNLAVDVGTLTGSYLPPEAKSIIAAILQDKADYAAATTPEARAAENASANANRAKLTAMGIPNVDALLGSGITLDSANLNQNRVGIPTIGQQTLDLSRENQAYNHMADTRDYNLRATVTMAELTGTLPDGTPTTAEQQRQIGNLWMVAENTGVIPKELATMYGIPEGTPTQAAYRFAEQLALDKRQVDISQQNANTSAFSAANTAANMNADNARQERAAKFSDLVTIWQTTGKAPAGLEGYGVQAGEPYQPYKVEQNSEISDKDSSDLYIGLSEDFNSDQLATQAQQLGMTEKELARYLLEQNKSYLNNSDYGKLNEWISNNLD